MTAKKIIYIFLFALLGFLFSLLIHAAIESIYLNVLARDGVTPVWNFIFGLTCSLPAWLVIGLPVVGVLAGTRLGFIGWRIVYIEKRHWRFKRA